MNSLAMILGAAAASALDPVRVVVSLLPGFFLRRVWVVVAVAAVVGLILTVIIAQMNARWLGFNPLNLYSAIGGAVASAVIALVAFSIRALLRRAS